MSTKRLPPPRYVTIPLKFLHPQNRTCRYCEKPIGQTATVLVCGEHSAAVCDEVCGASFLAAERVIQTVEAEN